MTLFITILAFIVIFSVLILIHELGHFTAAKRAGVKVEEFGFGLPPRMIGIKKGETIYSINWIPFGGFVRMLGEDSTTKESRGSERSFANQPLRTQAWIVVAGVVMNLLLSFVLLTVGFLMGIEPLIATQEDFYNGIVEGTVNVEPGFLVVESNQPYHTVDYNGQDLELRSFEAGDRILTDGSTPLTTLEQWDAMLEQVNAGEEQPLISMDRANGSGGGEFLTIELLEQTEFAPFYLSRLIYKGAEGALWEPYLKDGDSIITVDGIQILDAESLYAAMKGKPLIEVGVYRPGFGDLTVSVPLPVTYPLVTFIEPGSPAEMAGVQLNDQILSLNDHRINSAQTVTELTAELAAAEQPMTYSFLRDGEELKLSVTPREEDLRIGIGLADILPNYGNLSLYEGAQPHTLLGFDQVQYGWSAPVVALEEMGRLAKSTAVMFFGVLKQFISGAGVPEGVSGPVGIAQMTFVTIQDGFAALLRFVALLSLSLGVINILPVPALDGGKFFFIMVQVITGKKLSPKYEQIIHAGGFFFLIALIFYITFNDVMNLL